MASRLEIDNKPFLQLILILSLCIVSFNLFSIIGSVVGIFYYGLTLYDLKYMIDLNQNKIEGVKFIQLFSAIGLFLVPPFFYGKITSENWIQKLSLSQLGKPINYLLILVLMVVSTAFVSWVIELNASMVLPEFMSGIEQWMRIQENKMGAATAILLTYDGIGSLFYILIIVAVVPALGEELLFRGILQKIFINWVNNPHVGIWITAILFSAFHMQFFGFFPRLLLGLMFGYVFWWSKSLWLPILGHFINNGSVVVASYFFPEMIDDADISFFSDTEYGFVFYIGSFIISAVVFYLIRKVNQQEGESTQNNKPIAV